MGPFRHSVDDGLDVRKAAFECMYTLLDTCISKLDIFKFLEYVENGLKDSFDIKVKGEKQIEIFIDFVTIDYSDLIKNLVSDADFSFSYQNVYFMSSGCTSTYRPISGTSTGHM